MPTTMSKFVCPIDFSEGSERALDQAIDIASSLSAQIELVHVFMPPIPSLPDLSVVTLAIDPAFIDGIAKQHKKLLEDALLRLRARAPNLQISSHLLQGDPAGTIAEFARDAGASLIVIGTHGRRGFQRFLLGSVAERVVRISSVPVLTVPLTDKDT